TFDAPQTLPIVIPLVFTVLVIALLVVRPLFAILLTEATGSRGVVKRPVRMIAGGVTALLPLMMVLSLGGDARAAFSGAGGMRRRTLIDVGTIAESITEAVLCAFVAVAFTVLAAYPARRSTTIRAFAMIGLLLFSVPTAIIAIGWIHVGQALGSVSI